MRDVLLDGDGQPVIRGFNWNSNELKAINTLYGLCLGITADGRVDDSEVLFLDVWLKGNADYLSKYPLNVVHDRVGRILDDGIITQDERDDLYEMLGQLVGGGFMESGAAGGSSNQLPVDQVGSIDFDGTVFCFTGKFIYGQRSDCEKAVELLGASAVKNVVKKLNYLVIGDLASRDWVATGHGRKIEKAIEYKKAGVNMFILSEHDWASFL